MHTFRTRFAKEIVAEFLPPSRPSRDVIVVASGMPSGPSQRALLSWLSRRGFWVFQPRYRGTWESGGMFLRHSPERDILDVVSGLQKPIVESWNGQTFRVRPRHTLLLGSSFGGPAVILASRDKRVHKAVALSPVIDWMQIGTEEPMAKLERFVREGFGEGYRFRRADWQRLARGTFYSPAYEADTVDGQKLYLVHAKDDQVVPWQPTAAFGAFVGAPHLLMPRGGHLGTGDIMNPKLSRKLLHFLRSK